MQLPCLSATAGKVKSDLKLSKKKRNIPVDLYSIIVSYILLAKGF